MQSNHGFFEISTALGPNPKIVSPELSSGTKEPSLCLRVLSVWRVMRSHHQTLHELASAGGYQKIYTFPPPKKTLHMRVKGTPEKAQCRTSSSSDQRTSGKHLKDHHMPSFIQLIPRLHGTVGCLCLDCPPQRDRGENIVLLLYTKLLVTTSKALVTRSDALVTTSDAPVTMRPFCLPVITDLRTSTQPPVLADLPSG